MVTSCGAHTPLYIKDITAYPVHQHLSAKTSTEILENKTPFSVAVKIED